jgi:hypothetical protein
VKPRIEACQAKISEPLSTNENRWRSGDCGRSSLIEADSQMAEITPLLATPSTSSLSDFSLFPVESPNDLRRGFSGNRFVGLVSRVCRPKYQDTTALRLARRKSFHSAGLRSPLPMSNARLGMLDDSPLHGPSGIPNPIATYAEKWMF